MKILVKGIVLSLLLTVGLSASEVTGNWVVVKVEEKSASQEPFMDMSFKEDGSFTMMEFPMGTWKHDKKAKQLVMKSGSKGFNGKNSILKLNKKQMVVKLSESTMHLMRLDAKEIEKENKASKLEGTWKVKSDGDGLEVFKFELPDIYTHVKSGDGMTDTSRGAWIYNSNNKTLIVMSMESPLQGKSIVSSIDGDKFVINNIRRGVVEATKESKSNSKIERLTFNPEDFSEERGFLPEKWQDLGYMAQTLSGVEYLQYKFAKLVVNANALEYSSVRSSVKADVNKPKVKFSNFTMRDGKIDEQYSQNYKGGLTGRYNNFFPEEDLDRYRVLKPQEITVSAGTFKCSVIEGIRGDDKVKFWMIIDKPGVYAKKIIEGEGSFGDVKYFLYELEKIQKK